MIDLFDKPSVKLRLWFVKCLILSSLSSLALSEGFPGILSYPKTEMSLVSSVLGNLGFGAFPGPRGRDACLELESKVCLRVISRGEERSSGSEAAGERIELANGDNGLLFTDERDEEEERRDNGTRLSVIAVGEESKRK